MSTIGYAHQSLHILEGTVKTTGTSANLTAGQFGLYDKNTHAVVTAGNAASHPYAYIATGSYYTTDNLGSTPYLGMKESVKTPGINAKYVSRFYKMSAAAAANQIVDAGYGTEFETDKTYYLRVEAKGTPVLRVLNRHMYKNVPFYTGCASTDCLEGCDKDYTDAALVMKGWADYITADPLLKLFVTATPYVEVAATTGTYTSADLTIVVADATDIAAGQLVEGVGIPVGTTVVSVASTTVTISAASTAAGTAAALTFSSIVDSSYVSPATSVLKQAVKAKIRFNFGYIDTVFGTCSFHPADFYQKEPIVGYISLVDTNGDPCVAGPKINSSTGEAITEVQAPVVPQGLGETVLRDYLKSREYAQIHFQLDPRRREIELDPVFTAVNKTGTYIRYYLQFSVPKLSNSTNTFNSDQYLVGFAVPTGTSVTAFEALFAAWFAANNPAVSLTTIA